VLAAGTGFVYGAVVVFGVAISLSLAIFIIGVPFFLFFIGVVRTLSLVEGRVVETLLGQRMPRRPFLGPRGGSWWVRIKAWFSDRRTWTTMVYLALQFPLGLFYFALTAGGLVVCFWAMVAPVVQVLGDVPIITGEPDSYLPGWAVLPVMAAGFVGVFVVARIARLVGSLHGRYAKWMLVGSLGAEDPATGPSAA
jgi:hypothetical protein